MRAITEGSAAPPEKHEGRAIPAARPSINHAHDRNQYSSPGEHEEGSVSLQFACAWLATRHAIRPALTSTVAVLARVGGIS